jgi:hypothetical protein
MRNGELYLDLAVLKTCLTFHVGKESMNKHNKYINQVISEAFPSDFRDWDLADANGWSVAHAAAAHNHIPDGFNMWALATKSGRTVAHVAAHFGYLPADFNQWTLTTNMGWTVAHEAVRMGLLPEKFTQWELADKDWWTVAHEAAQEGHLPANFDQWDLADRYGIRISDIGEAKEQYAQWRIRSGFSCTKDECDSHFM